MLGENKAPLVFLSACRTAESRLDSIGEQEQEAIESFVRALVRAGVPNVIGWDGSVYDLDATSFARTFYKELAEFASVPYAVATARRDVLRAHQNDPQKGRHWHLARAYSGSLGSGSLCDRTKPKRRFRRGAGYREFLDKAENRVQVATAQEFVGRRRQAQSVLRVFRDKEKAGVLIYGMGNIGKSSLAARIANRMPKHRTVVIYERYDGLALFDRLLTALPGNERHKWDQQWRECIANNCAMLGNALEEMLTGPFDDQPILLIIDDLEQILEIPSPGQKMTTVKDAPGMADTWRLSLGGVLRAFEEVDTESKLLLTSRYLFSFFDRQQRDLADALEQVQLRPMGDKERAKQWQAAERTAERVQDAASDEEKMLVGRVLDVAGGNPGLQEILCRPILAGELKAAGDALESVEQWKTSGKLPKEESAAQEFFQRVSFEIYRKALTETQYTQLRAFTLFSEGLPVPLPVIEAVGDTSGVREPSAAIHRLVGLGLVDSWGNIDDVGHYAANPLSYPLVDNKLTEKEQAYLATAVIDRLSATWQDSEGNFPSDPRGLEAARLALIGSAPAAVLEKVALAAGRFLFNRKHNAKEALAILESARVKIDAEGVPLSPQFLLLASNCAERIGQRELQVKLLEKGVQLKSDDKVGLAQITAIHAEATIVQEGPEKTLETLRKAVALFEDAKDERSRAVTMGQIADILSQRGETDEALRIQIEERLPVAEATKDLESISHIRFSCAQLRLQRGGLEQGEIQTIYQELSESFAINLKFQRADAVAAVGNLLGQVLAEGGHSDEALKVLDQSAAAFEKLQQSQQAERVREIQKQIREKKK